MNHPDPQNSNPERSPAAPEASLLEEKLRRLRYAEPAPELRRRALTAAAEVLEARTLAGRPGLGGWWRELALTATAVLIFWAPWPAGGPAPADAAPAAPTELAHQLDLGRELAGYLAQRWTAGQTPASASSASSGLAVPFASPIRQSVLIPPGASK